MLKFDENIKTAGECFEPFLKDHSIPEYALYIFEYMKWFVYDQKKSFEEAEEIVVNNLTHWADRYYEKDIQEKVKESVNAFKKLRYVGL